MKKLIFSIFVWIYFSTVIIFFFLLILLLYPFIVLFDKNRSLPNILIRWLAICMLKVNPRWKIHIIGLEKVDKNAPVIFISNHQSFMDMPLLYLLPWQMRWVAKQGLLKIPFLGWMIKMAGHVSINREMKTSVKRLEKLENILNKGMPVMIFPEGTRTMNGEIRPFKRGAFQLARNLSLPVQPIIIDGTFRLLKPHSWYFEFKQNLTIKLTDKVYPDRFENASRLREACSAQMVNELDKIRKT